MSADLGGGGRSLRYADILSGSGEEGGGGGGRSSTWMGTSSRALSRSNSISVGQEVKKHCKI